jgi:cytochrome P450
LLARLRVELDEHIHNKVGKWTDLFDASAEGNMPVFNGFVREVLRLYAVIPGPMYRVLLEPIQIGQYTVPEGTTVGTQSFTLHRQADVFPNPLELNVERWFVPQEGSDPQAEGFKSGEGTEKMRASYVPFGVGPRVCVGQKYVELYSSRVLFAEASATVWDRRCSG